MILSDLDLRKLLQEGSLKVDPLREKIEGAHIELHLAGKLLKYVSAVGDLADNASFKTEEVLIPSTGYKLEPGEFVLGSTSEKVTIPNGYLGMVETKGSIARAGIQSHNTDGHIDPGFSGNITLEIKNNSNRPLVIYADIPFVQLYVFKLTSECDVPYQGRYQNQEGATVYIKD